MQEVIAELSCGTNIEWNTGQRGDNLDYFLRASGHCCRLGACLMCEFVVTSTARPECVLGNLAGVIVVDNVDSSS